MRLTNLLVGLISSVGASTAFGSDGTCKNDGACVGGLTDQAAVADSIGFIQRTVLAGTATDSADAGPPSTTVQQAWNNHLKAFQKQNVNKIMKDYYEDSEVRVFDNNGDPKATYFKGRKEIKGMFTSLFADLYDLTTLEAPVIQVDEVGRQVFLVWKVPGCGYHNATDTFIFKEVNGAMKIARQNIVVTKQVSPLREAWNNHFSAFAAQALGKIMEDYDAASVVRVFNNVGAQYVEHVGLDAIEAMFKSLFVDLDDLSTLTAPVIDVDEDESQVFLVWKAPGCGYDTATDTFIFKKVSSGKMKIARQNIVVTKVEVSSAT